VPELELNVTTDGGIPTETEVEPVEPEYTESPLYVATMVLLPAYGRTTWSATWPPTFRPPELSWTIPPGSAVPLSVKVTEPVGVVVAPLPDTYAVSRTDVPAEMLYELDTTDTEVVGLLWTTLVEPETLQ
jgi:hypothetical protein